MPWDAEFEYPVPGLRTLRDAANYIMKLPKAEQAKTHWQTAGEMLLFARAVDVCPHSDVAGAGSWEAGASAAAATQGCKEISDRKMKEAAS